jgi:SAM-dependent methyltransferase
MARPWETPLFVFHNAFVNETLVIHTRQMLLDSMPTTVNPAFHQLSLRKFSQLSWDVNCLLNPVIRSSPFFLSRKAARCVFATRMLRYWFTYHFLRTEFQRLGRAISVCEVGVDTGQMRRFLNLAAEMPGIAAVKCSSWIGVDCHIKKNELAGLGYECFMEQNIEQSDSWLREDYDAIVMLHVLEHLYHPEKTLERIAPRMKPGSVLVGGFPSVPNWCVGLRERQIRPHPNANGHLSVFSPVRVRNMAVETGLTLEFLAGAYFLRASGLFLENYEWWLRFNLIFGALFPFWPGEIYWVMRKREK